MIMIFLESASTKEVMDPIFVKLDELETSDIGSEFIDFLHHCLSLRENFTTFEWNDYDPDVLNRLENEFNYTVPCIVDTWLRIIF